MEKCKIQICLLGYQRYQNEIDRLCDLSSKLFEIVNCVVIKSLPTPDISCVAYSDELIIKLLKSQNMDNSKYDLCMCFIDTPIEENYCSRDLQGFDSKTVVCSSFGMKDIFKEADVDFFNYFHGHILYEVVQMATLRVVDENQFIHFDTRNCLFDMCGVKDDVALKFDKPQLCSQCISKIESRAVDKNFIRLLKKEFKTFKKPLFYRILAFVKKKPILSIFITIVGTVIINILSSYIFEIIAGFSSK